MIVEEIRTRHVELLRNFVADPEELLDLMRTTGTIISGPFALRYLEGNSLGWADDIDFYTPHDPEIYKKVVRHFQTQGYRTYTPKCAGPKSTATAKKTGR